MEDTFKICEETTEKHVIIFFHNKHTQKREFRKYNLNSPLIIFHHSQQLAFISLKNLCLAVCMKFFYLANENK